MAVPVPNFMPTLEAAQRLKCAARGNVPNPFALFEQLFRGIGRQTGRNGSYPLADIHAGEAAGFARPFFAILPPYDLG